MGFEADKIKEIAKATILNEAASVTKLADFVDADFKLILFLVSLLLIAIFVNSYMIVLMMILNLYCI